MTEKRWLAVRTGAPNDERSSDAVLLGKFFGYVDDIALLLADQQCGFWCDGALYFSLCEELKLPGKEVADRVNVVIRGIKWSECEGDGMTDDEMILISAIRYALPQMTYVVGVTADEVSRRWPSLSSDARGVIVRDLSEALSGDPRTGAMSMTEVDREVWQALLGHVRENFEAARISTVEDRVNLLETTLRGVLLFHSASPWDDEKRTVWRSLTGVEEATTKSLCDAVRRALDQDERGPL